MNYVCATNKIFGVINIFIAYLEYYLNIFKRDNTKFGSARLASPPNNTERTVIRSSLTFEGLGQATVGRCGPKSCHICQEITLTQKNIHMAFFLNKQNK